MSGFSGMYLNHREAVAAYKPPPPDPERGTGRTTKQMENAAFGAVYIWIEGAPLTYPQRLAEGLGRNDLKIIRPPDLLNMVRYGWADREIVIDHATRLTGEQQARVNQLRPAGWTPARLAPGK